jgi:hypothetical protein
MHIPVGDVEVPPEQDVAGVGIVDAPEKLLSEIGRTYVPVERAKKKASQATDGESPRRGAVTPCMNGGSPSVEVALPGDKHSACNAAFACDAGRRGVKVEA